jgi:hypothetical protein
VPTQPNCLSFLTLFEPAVASEATEVCQLSLLKIGVVPNCALQSFRFLTLFELAVASEATEVCQLSLLKI